MTTHQRLYKDMIHDPRLWTLYLALDIERIDVMAYSPLEDHSLFVADIPLDMSSVSRVSAIEEAIYDNPLLLNDFNRVVVVSRSDARALLPSSLAADVDMASDILSEMTGSTGKMVVDEIPLLDVAMCHFVESDLYNFICRTFSGVKFIHSLTALTRYYHGTQRGAGSLTSHVNLRKEYIDIVLYQSDKLLLANTYRWYEPADVLYFILATRSVWNVDRPTPVALGGDREVRELVTPLLQKYLPTVMPAIFPAAMFRAGGAKAMTVPTDMIVLPLCE